MRASRERGVRDSLPVVVADIDKKADVLAEAACDAVPAKLRRIDLIARADRVEWFSAINSQHKIAIEDGFVSHDRELERRRRKRCV